MLKRLQQIIRNGVAVALHVATIDLPIDSLKFH